MNSRLRILALVPEAFGGFGGIAQYNRDLISALAKDDRVNEIRILPRLASAGVNLPSEKITQSEPIFQRHAHALHATREALRLRPGLVFCGHFYTASLARYVAKLAGAPYVVQLHGTEIWPRPSAGQRNALEKADAVLCVSRDTRARLLNYTRVHPNRAIIIPNTVSADFRPGDREASRMRLGLQDEFALLSVGRLDDREGYKGHDRVIDSLASLSNGPRRVVYLISGDGRDRARLEAQAAAVGVDDRVRFLGYSPREQLPDLYRAADLFVLPSTGEGFGIVFLEAMASGTPALGLAVGGAPDPLGFGDWGRAVTVSEFDSGLAAAIASPRPDPAMMHQAVAERFGFDRFADQVADQLVDRFSAAA